MRLFNEGELNKWRFKGMPFPNTPDMLTDGAFQIPYKAGTNIAFFVIATHGTCDPMIKSPDEAWEHMSARAFDEAHTQNPKERQPTWDEMCYLKDLFWHPEECVVQFHPPKSVYVNSHPNVLHLWRKHGVNQETPPLRYV